MTEKLFYENSYHKSFSACVLACEQDGEAWNIILDRTAFFPEGGGQYADTGRMDDALVLDVQEQQGIIRHRTDRPIEAGTKVSCSLHWEERFMKMQQHTGEHIVSGLVHEKFGYNNVGFHLGSEDCTMDFDGEITKEELAEIEYLANEAVVKNLEVQVSYPTKEELESINYRSKIEIEGQVRIVTIPGYDICACCAPHVARTGEIGQIRLTNVQHYKGGVRVTLLCGFRALADYNKKTKSVKEISALLCAKENEVSEAVEHLKKENSQIKARNIALQQEILRYKAQSIEITEGIACLFEKDLDGDSPRFLMNQVLEKDCQICAVFCGDDREGYRYVIGSKTMDLRMLVKELNAVFSGRGGGKPEMVQGSLKGNENELRAWIQKKVGTMYEHNA